MLVVWEVAVLRDVGSMLAVLVWAVGVAMLRDVGGGAVMWMRMRCVCDVIIFVNRDTSHDKLFLCLFTVRVRICF